MVGKLKASLALAALALTGAWPSSGLFIPVQYIGPCDLVSCAEAYSVTRGMTANYTGPLFQISNGSSTLDIGQSSHTANMSTWSAFCSGVASNCVYTKFYAQINITSNDLTPFNTANKTPFTIEAATGLPIINDVQGTGTQGSPTGYQYAIGGSSDSASTGITAAGAAESLIVVGQAIQNNNNCCGQFGTAHVWTPCCTAGTDFMLGTAFDFTAPGGCQIARAYCLIDDVEVGTGFVLGSRSTFSFVATPYVAVLTWDPTGSGTEIGYINSSPVFTNTPYPNGSGFSLNSGKSIHFAGGGDLTPANIEARELIITNSTLSSAQVAAITTNVRNFYPALSFPVAPSRPSTYVSGPGDVVSSAKYFVGTRAYSAAEAAAGTQKMMHVINTDVTRNCDILVAANGGLGNTTNCSSGPDNGLSATAFCGIYAAFGGTGHNGSENCVFDELYDQTGNGFNFTAITSTHAKLIYSCIVYSPCLQFDVDSGISEAVGQSPVWTSVPQPYTVSLVGQRDGSTSTPQTLLTHNSSNTVGFFAAFAASPNLFLIETNSGGAFTNFTATANDSAFHAIQGVFNSSSSILFIDGNSTTGNAGTDAAASSPQINIGDNTAFPNGHCINCEFGEIGFWGSGFTGTQQTNMNSNQHSYWGF